MYVTQARLKELIRDAQKTGRLSDEFAGVLLQMANGLYRRHRYRGDPDDFAQECVLLIMRKVHLCDTRQNPFSWLTTCMANEYLAGVRERWMYDKRVKKYADLLKTD